VVEKKQADQFQSFFVIPLNNIVKDGAKFTVTASDLEKLVGDINEKRPTLVYKSGKKIFLRPGAGELWMADDKEVTPVVSENSNGDYSVGRVGSALVVNELKSGKEVARVEAGKVLYEDPKNDKKMTVFGFQPTKVTKVKSYDPKTKKIVFLYAAKGDAAAEATLEPTENAGEWQITGGQDLFK